MDWMHDIDDYGDESHKTVFSGQVKPSTRRERLDREIGISKNSEMISQAKISCFGSLIHFFLFTFFLVLFLMTLFGGGAMLIESIIEILG